MTMRDIELMVDGEVKEWPQSKPYQVRRHYTYTDNAKKEEPKKEESVRHEYKAEVIERVLRSAWELDIATMVGEL